MGQNSSCCDDKSNGISWSNATMLSYSIATTTKIVTSTSMSIAISTKIASSTASSATIATNSSTSFCPPALPLGAGLGIPLALSLASVAILSFLLLRKKPVQAPVYHEAFAGPNSGEASFKNPFESEVMESSSERQPELDGRGISGLETGSSFQWRRSGRIG